MRYTSVLELDHFSESYFEIIESLQAKGYNMLRVKNTLGDPVAIYCGINAVVADPSGFKFEMQFHAESSFGASCGKGRAEQDRNGWRNSRAEQERLAEQQAESC